MVPSFPPREEVVLAPINSPSGTQQHMQREVGMATHSSTTTGSPPTSPHMSEGHSGTTCTAMRWRSHPPKRRYGGALTRAGSTSPVTQKHGLPRSA